MTNLSPDEENALRARHLPSFARPKAPTDRVKEEVSAEEYALRLARQQKRNHALVEADKKRRIDRAIAIWKQDVGPTFAEANTDLPPIMDRVNRLVSGQGKHRTSVVLYGPVGIGKSWQAYAFIAEAMNRGALTPGQIVRGSETGILGNIAAGGFKRPELIRELQEPRNKLYFIDDVGQGYFSREEARTEAWFELIDHVYNKQLTLILTTNLRPEATGAGSMGAWMGARAFDRLQALLGGRDGFITPGNVNKRPSVAEKNEEKYRPTAGRKSPF